MAPVLKVEWIKQNELLAPRLWQGIQGISQKNSFNNHVPSENQLLHAKEQSKHVKNYVDMALLGAPSFHSPHRKSRWPAMAWPWILAPMASSMAYGLSR